MKKLFFLAAFAVLCLTTNASFGQQSYKLLQRYSYSSNTTQDTCTNSGSAEMYTGLITNAVSILNIQFTITEISGTTGGKVYLESSLDSTNWVNYYFPTNAAYDTITPADVASQTFRYQLTDAGDRYYRVRYVGTGTMVAAIKGSVIGRRRF